MGGRPLVGSTSGRVGPPTYEARRDQAAPDGASNDSFGGSVDLDQGTAVIGAINDDGLGSAYVYTRSGDEWAVQQKLTASDRTTRDQLGYSVAVDAGTIVVGAPAFNGTGRPGSAYVYVRSGTAWVEQAKLVAADPQPDDSFGTSVNVERRVVVAGASSATTARGETGSAFVFIRDGIDWPLVTQLSAPNGQRHDFFGGDVAIGGPVLLIAASGKNTLVGQDAGAAYVVYLARSG